MRKAILLRSALAHCIGQAAVNNSRGRCKRVRLSLCCIDNVDHFGSARFQKIGNQRAMTTPPQRFRTHDRSRSNLLRKTDKSIYAFAKFFRLHVIGVTAE